MIPSDFVPVNEAQSVHSTVSLTCQVVAASDLDLDTRGAMWALYDQTYESACRSSFEADLSDKDEVMLLQANGELAGFTTLKLYQRIWHGAPIRVVYSGDTVVARRHWGQTALSFEWVRHLGAIKRRWPAERLVWFLLVKGHRTYRYLHVFAHRFFPSEYGSPPELTALANFLARDRFPQDYSSHSGLVEFNPSRGHLRPELAEPRADERGRPGVTYFLARNPGYRHGHELVCVCDIDESNMKPMTLRLFRQGLHG